MVDPCVNFIQFLYVPSIPRHLPTTCFHLSSPACNERYLYDPFTYQKRGEKFKLNIPPAQLAMWAFSAITPQNEKRLNLGVIEVLIELCRRRRSFVKCKHPQTNRFRSMHLRNSWRVPVLLHRRHFSLAFDGHSGLDGLDSSPIEGARRSTFD